MNQLTDEEKAVCDLAKAYHAEQGYVFKALSITPFTIGPLTHIYTVLGNVQGSVCCNCGIKHSRSACMQFLHVGDGFVLLEQKEVKYVTNDVLSVHDLLGEDTTKG